MAGDDAGSVLPAIDACYAAAMYVPEPHEESDWRLQLDTEARVIDAWRLHGTGRFGRSVPAAVALDRCVREALLGLVLPPYPG